MGSKAIMNGADLLIKKLADAGVTACFANPGTSEMQLVAALDKEPRIRAVLGLFEGVVTGAADGFARMTDKPALTLLHLGPGYANGIANLHNASRARVPVLNMIGDHATHHLELDAPLTSDIDGLTSAVCAWTGVSSSSDDLAEVGLKAWQASMAYPGQVTAFVAPANHAWDPATSDAAIPKAPAPNTLSDEQIREAANALRNSDAAALFMGGHALRENGLVQAGRIAEATGARLITETFFTRQQRGAGRVETERLPYFGEMAAEHLQDLDTLVIIGSKPPVSFFAYPGKPGWLSPEGVNLLRMGDHAVDSIDTLTRIANELNAPETVEKVAQRVEHSLEAGPINAVELGKVLANRLPENAIVVDEGATNGLGAFLMTGNAAPHDWLTLTGGAIGAGLPMAVGAALGCPDRKVISLEADGSAMYTVQALWTMVREDLDIAVLILNNGSYAILNIELARVGVEQPGPTALSLLDLTNPAIEWTDIAKGMGMPAERVDTVDALDSALERAMNERGPRLIEVML
jgi:acetolactate synthase-1/2/3 large subunit